MVWEVRRAETRSERPKTHSFAEEVRARLKVLLDTDVLVDVAFGREAHGPESRAVVEWCHKSPGAAFVAWHSISNLFYLLRAAQSDAIARLFIEHLLEFMDVVAGGGREVRQALQLEIRDFEDALQITAALYGGADCIVTRNVRDYRHSPVPAMTPAKFLRHLARK